jgi:facilitated trehalose transporter
MSGFLQDRLGRRTCLILVNFPQLAAWTILHFASSVTHLFLAMFLLGLALGLMEAPSLSYIGETAQPKYRGLFSAFTGVFFNLGYMLESVIGSLVTWRTMVLWNVLGPLMSIGFMWFVSTSLITKPNNRFKII